MNTLPGSLQPVPLRTEREISVLLNGLRKQQKISQKELGKRLGLQQSRVSELLSNPTAMRVEQFMQILAILGMQLQVQSRDAVFADPTLQESGGSVTRSKPQW
ncbi:helix-turn-helix transcriptional regulator [Neopusillimonas maritima]|jgi:transcriptional regulator with XRE-family HTH domain|uniref:HTH cro/C1-type domain-containing protein n=1 Tax=Neopusillimonas maritima TaxID=2026239 RepID=A0ABX9MZK1_9BURK|nr:helix-turn-helix transcriptional regulator [Neopusillimonas maritima]RII83479.1 hypothetical protein CJO09_07760 [Neopusillimonas maritima]|tara:strand:- start:86197 stop:86505 length:309 start_codon:yes stop_codon:yes gene_type:complete